MGQDERVDPESPTGTGIPMFLRRVGHYLRPYRGRCLLLLLGMFINILVATGTSLSFKFLIDSAIVPRNGRMLALILGAVVGAFILASLVSIGRDYLYAEVGSRALRDLRVRLFGHLQRLSARFYARTRVGDIMTRFSTDLAAVENGIMLALPGGILSVLSLIMSVAVLFWLEWRLALLSVLAGPLCLIGPRLLGKHAAQAGDRMQKQEGVIASTLQETIYAHPVIKAYSLQARIGEAFARQTETLRTYSYRANVLNYLMERTPNLGIQFFNILVLTLGGVLAYYRYLSIGSLVSFQAIAVSFNDSVTWIASLLPYLSKGAAGMRRIDALLTETPTVTDRPGAPELPRLTGEIAFNGVSFSYAGEQKNLDHVSLAIRQGQRVALVGPSGSGKSTVINLLLRFYDTSEGTVTFDGVSLREVSQASLRAQIGVVFQESFLFNTTVRENILVGRPGASDVEITAAARGAEIHDAILRMPEGYHTVVGERGGRLSGGQRQRLSIARALLRDPQILILDEATSALDPGTEAAVQETLERISAGRTVISVTHRLANATASDRIFVLQDGRLAESGTHQELAEQGGVYSGLWRKQSGLTLNVESNSAQVGIDWLRSLPFLKKVATPLLEELPRRFVTELYPENRDVVIEGDPGDKFYIIVRGHVAVMKQEQPEPRAAPVTLDDGDYFGEIALLRHVPRTATVRTLTPAVFLTLKTDQFLDLLQKAPGLRKTMEDTLGKR